MKLRELLPGARRRRKPRADGPRTIVPAPKDSPAARMDAAKERLRREIPPPADEEEAR